MRALISTNNSSFISMVLALFLLWGCGGQPPAPPLPEVTYLEVTTTPTALVTELPGRTTAFMVSEVRPQVGGIILERTFEEGALVEKGQPLYQIDPAIYQANVATAKANVLRAQAAVRSSSLLAKRYRELVKVNAVSKQEYDNALAAYQQAKADEAAAKAALDTAQINLRYTKVTSPITGIIGKSSVTPGTLVTPDQAQPLALVQQPDPMYVDVTQSSTDLLRLKKAAENKALVKNAIPGLNATLILPDGSEYSQPGSLLFADVTVDPATGSYLTRALFPNSDGLLLQNLYVRVRISEAVSPTAILVPQRLISRDIRGNAIINVLAPVPADAVPAEVRPSIPKGRDVYKIEPRPVVIDRAIDNQQVVLEGLQAGEKILVDGGMQLRPGQQLVIITPYVETPGQTAPQQPTDEKKQ